MEISLYVDCANNEYIAGWAWVPALPEKRVKVEVLSRDNEILAQTYANEYGEDLHHSGIGDGQYRFAFEGDFQKAEKLRCVDNSGSAEPFEVPIEKSFTYDGICPICEKPVTFTSSSSWFRDNLFCGSCGSIPRERALMAAINNFEPSWRSCAIHESSPVNRGASQKLMTSSGYIGSQFYPHMEFGEMVNGFRNEDLTKLTFEDNSIDLHITQDVFEHVFDADKAFSEIARTLKPGGMHIFTVPIVNGVKNTTPRAKMENGDIIYLEEAVYHGNPVSEQGSLVVWDWGYDIVQRIYESSKMITIILQIDDISRGIRAEYIDVLVSIKV